MKLFSYGAALLIGSCSPQTSHVCLDSVSFLTLACIRTTAVAFSRCIHYSLRQIPNWQTFSRWTYIGLSWRSLSFLTYRGQRVYIKGTGVCSLEASLRHTFRKMQHVSVGPLLLAEPEASSQDPTLRHLAFSSSQQQMLLQTVPEIHSFKN